MTSLCRSVTPPATWQAFSSAPTLLHYITLHYNILSIYSSIPYSTTLSLTQSAHYLSSRLNTFHTGFLHAIHLSSQRTKSGKARSNVHPESTIFLRPCAYCVRMIHESLVFQTAARPIISQVCLFSEQTNPSCGLIDANTLVSQFRSLLRSMR